MMARAMMLWRCLWLARWLEPILTAIVRSVIAWSLRCLQLRWVESRVVTLRLCELRWWFERLLWWYVRLLRHVELHGWLGCELIHGLELLHVSELLLIALHL